MSGGEMKDIILKQLEVGPMENFIYFIGDKKNKEVLIIDPAWDVNYLLETASQEGLKISGVLVTHGHSDHTNGVEELLKKLDIPVFINKTEADFFKFPWGNENVKKVDSFEKVKVGEIEVELIHTPGHTPGSQCFLVRTNSNAPLLIAGDTLFINGCGRCDLPGGNVEQMFDTIYNKLMKMDNKTVIFPGHNYAQIKSDTLENQKKSNPFMQHENLMSFISRRLPNLK